MKLRQASTLGLAALAALGAPAMAQGTGWYGGVSAGRSAATIDDARISAGLLGQALGTASIDDHDRDTGYKLFGGYQLSPNFGVEAGYFSLGHFGYTAHTVPPGTLSGDMRLRGMNVDLVGTLPLGARVSLLARVGATSVRASDRFSATGAARVPYANASPSERSTNVKVGLGLSYDITDALSLRAEAERYRLKDAVGNTGHADLFSIGLVYRFGAAPMPVRAAAPPPVYVAPAPAPAPVMRMEPPPPPAPAPVAVAQPARMRFTLSADALFDFDQSVLRPAGRQSLDKLAADLRGLQYDAVRVTGHTDRLGSQQYNLALSQRRADAVSAYLVASGAVAAGRISTRAADESEPVTKPGDCKGAHATPALTACLQADRRVEVEVSGIR